ncbi:peptidoglycan DD-metalloendopeptidase family protein [Spongiivirga citrea]|uniref:Peptidoglycan DD-metalloendopeptidase family protein n=1 Tax=Spongiivirga citrea TaxID=1481457 RepID=A0A6M0CGV3_9FLAO|nr:peptidoglycan DD-metalloendopeptidase family protein [Spongiivirga citrea]NER17148.1 peptidoglycan DD-metalloendopeptidase family protein [Spongiivirga citrea]
MKKLWALGAAAILVVVACKNDKKDEDVPSLETDLVVQELKAEPIQIIEFGYNLNEYEVLNDTVTNGDSFGWIMEKNNVSRQKVYNIVQSVKDCVDLRKIRTGKPYTILASKDSLKTPQAFIYQANNIDYWVVDFKDSIHGYKSQKPVTIKEKTASGVIESSLSEAITEAGLPYNLVNELSTVYAWTVDFWRLQKGDKFKVVYDEKFINDTLNVGIDKIKSAYFEHNGTPIYAFEFINDSIVGGVDYFDAEGKTLRKAFLKAPVKFSYVSSKYNLRRRIAYYGNRIRPHRGTDYAARLGSPIMATANGTVTKASYTRGNGNYVKIRHNGTYSTQYLHMKKRNVKKGQFVKQGDIIGWVGMTGNTSGPHVCYRFWKNGREVDPYKQDLPDAEPMKEEIKPTFFKFVAPLKEQLDSIPFPVKEIPVDTTQITDLTNTKNGLTIDQPNDYQSLEKTSKTIR